MKFRLFSRLIAASALLLAMQAMGAGNAVRTVTLEAPAVDGARLQMQLSATPRQEVSTLDNPRRIVIDLPGTTLAKGLSLPQAAGPVRSLRSSQRPDGTTLRLVLVLDRKLDPKVAVNGTQLTIELGAWPVAKATPAAPAPVRAAHAPADAGRDIIVAVDAGHGGKDPGASGANGSQEKDLTLAIARALAKRIDAEPGMRAYLTRDSDQYILLPRRVELARSAHADIFISVHADSHKDRQISGSSVYVLSERGASSEAARLLAVQENAADLIGGVPGVAAGDPLASLLMDLAQNTSKTRSSDVAERLLGRLDRVGTIRKSKVQQAAFVVLKSPGIPSVLVETAYISNPAEEKKLGDPAHQEEIAAAIFSGLREYFRESPPDGTLFARQRAASRAAEPAMVADSTGP